MEEASQAIFVSGLSEDVEWTEEQLEAELNRLRKVLSDQVTEIRWTIENGGIVRNGMFIDTARGYQDSLNRLVSASNIANITHVDYKASTGWIRNIPLANIKYIAAEIAYHVQACYTAEMTHHEAIKNATAEELLAHDVHAGWPS